MRIAKWGVVVIAAGLMSACAQSGSQGSGGAGKSPVPTPGPGPRPGERSAISDLSGQAKVEIESCMRNEWKENSQFWNAIGGAALLKCLREQVRVEGYDVTPQFQIDFTKLFYEMNAKVGGRL